MSAPIVVIADPHGLDPEPAVRLLADAGFDVRVTETRDHDIVARLGAEAVALVTGYCQIDRELLGRMPQLEIVATMSSGVDMVDLEAARERGLWVCNLPDGSTEEVAVHAFALILCALRSLPTADRIVRSGQWWQAMTDKMRRPSTLTLGLLGAGRIARTLIELTRPMFGRIVAYDPFVPDEAWPQGVDRMELEEVIETSDVLSLHVPLTEQTRNLMDRRRIRMMKPGAVLVNVSRGGLVDEAALAEALDVRHLFGAGLDVFAAEPPGADSPLAQHQRCTLSPHSAYMSVESKLAYVTRPAENILAWHATATPLTPVLSPTKSS